MPLLQILEPTSTKDSQEQPQDFAVGIDLGTTNSLIGIVVNDEVKFFSDKNHNEIHPSIVSFDEKGNFSGCGNLAVEGANQLKVSSIKRLMGKTLKEISALGKSFKNQFPFEIDETTKEDESIRIIIGKKKYSPEEISAQILKHLKFLAQNTIGEEIKKAVITVPAYFNEAARNATKLAAQIAGLEVLRLVNEPTAAALAYNLDQSREGIYLVYDLGGGTFDISVLKMQKGIFKVLGVSGDSDLGGDDFDLLILEKIKEKITAKNLTFNESYNLKKLAKSIKEELSHQENVTIKIEFRDQNINFSITRQEFNSMIENHIGRTIKLTKNIIDDLEIDTDQIEGIVLVGGSTRIPLAKEELTKIFGKAKIFNDHDPDFIVAYGAALQANNLIAKNNDSLLLDVLPLSLGLETMGGIVEKIIYRNSTIPAAVTREYTTYVDGQTGLKLHIVQGERELVKDCRSLAEFEIKNIPPLKAGIPRIAVTFKVDADGILIVSAQDKITGQIQEIQVKPSYGLKEDEIKKMLMESLQNSAQDMENRLLAEIIVETKQDIIFLEKDLKTYKDLVSLEEKKQILQQIEKLKKLINTSQDRNLIEKEQKYLEQISREFITKKVSKILSTNIAGKNIDEMI